jgi:non-ribosomal peptide synthetase component E (peptide arylation enzyme)
VKGRLSAFKVPTRWLVRRALDEVPLMGSGKVDKAALQRLLVSEGSVAAA